MCARPGTKPLHRPGSRVQANSRAPTKPIGWRSQRPQRRKIIAEKTAKKVPAPLTGAEAEQPGAGGQKTVVDKTVGLSQEVLESVESGQRAAIEAMRKYVETVDAASPANGRLARLSLMLRRI